MIGFALGSCCGTGVMSDQSDLSEKSVSVSDMLISNGEGKDRLRGASQQKQLLYAGYNFGLHPDTPNMDKQLATWCVYGLFRFSEHSPAPSFTRVEALPETFHSVVFVLEVEACSTAACRSSPTVG